MVIQYKRRQKTSMDPSQKKKFSENQDGEIR